MKLAVVVLLALTAHAATLVRIQCGGPGGTDAAGNVWQADTGYTGGAQWNATYQATMGTLPVPYSTLRFSDPADSPISYVIILPPTTAGVRQYRVTLGFAEPNKTGPNQRLFNAVITGGDVPLKNPALSGMDKIDVFADAGGALKPVLFSFPIASVSGQIAIDLIPTLGKAIISFIQVDDDVTTTPAASHTYSYFWQGAVQAGAAGFAVNLPATDSPSLTSAGGTRPSAVLEWPTSQSTSYAWFSFVLPAGYPANGTIGYTLETRSGDSTNYANVYLGVACSSSVLDDPTSVESSPLPITAMAASARTVTSGSITPNGGGLPVCSAGQRVWINLRVDTNVASHVMTQPFDLVSALFRVQGSI